MSSILIHKGKPAEIRSDGTWSYLSATGPALERMRQAELSPAMVELVAGLFDKIGLDIVDTGERVIVSHNEGNFNFEDESEGGTVDYDISIMSYQVDVLMKNAKSGYSDPVARFRLVRVFMNTLPNLLDSLLGGTIVTNSKFRSLIGSKDLIHIKLVSPDKREEPDANFTMFFVNGTWHMSQGTVGQPDRVFSLSSDDALDLLRHGFGATKAGLLDIPEIANWYMSWRKKVEVPVE